MAGKKGQKKRFCADLVRMHPGLRGDLLDRLVTSQRFQRDLGLKLACKLPALRHSRIPSKVRDTPWLAVQFSGSTSESGIAAA